MPFLFFAFLIGIPCSYFLSSFLSNFYIASYQIFIITLVSQVGFTFLAFQWISAHQTEKRLDIFLKLTLFGTLTAWTLYLFRLADQFPSLFEAWFYQIESNQYLVFAIALLLSIPIIFWINAKKFFHAHTNKLDGIWLAFIFFINYLLLVSIFNQPAFDVDDIFFDADGLLWRWRFATENVRDYYFRPVHPFVLIIIRPLVWLISIFLNSDSLYATFILVAFAGALCVFLVWHFIKHTTQNLTYALLIATLFGASTAQLVFSSLIETYIFLAATALIFITALLKDKPFYVFVITGLVSFGITVSNFAQTIIAYFFIKRDFKQLIKYGLIVLALIVPLTLLNNFIYPNSQPYFWELSTFEGEGSNSFTATLQRANYLGRVMVLNSIVAPQPLILEEEIPFLKVWMFRASVEDGMIRIAKYETFLGNFLAYIWLGFILLGGFSFLKNFKKSDNRFSLTFILILLFNFFLHLQYGKDVFLYSVNWTYALILFLALAWQELANKTWFKIALLTFTILVITNNSQLILTLLTTSAQHIK